MSTSSYLSSRGIAIRKNAADALTALYQSAPEMLTLLHEPEENVRVPSLNDTYDARSDRS